MCGCGASQIELAMRSFIVFAVLIALNGCATCHIETFMKPQLQVGHKVIKPWSGKKSFAYSLTPNLELSLIGCNYLSDQLHDFICVGFEPQAGSRVKFSSNQYQIFSYRDSISRMESIPDWQVNVPFFPDKSGVFPSSTERRRGLPDSAVEKEISRNQYAVQAQFSFSAVSQFQGEEIVGTTFTLARQLRVFYLKLPLPKDSTNTTSIAVQLPPVQMNGVLVKFPVIAAARVTEEICHDPK